MKYASIIPTLKYKDAPVAIEWLCDVLGFEKHLVVEGDNNTITHAQLTFGNSMIMLGSSSKNEYGIFIQTPNDLQGYNTQSPYIIVEDIDEHYNHVKSKGAEIVMELEEQHYGGKLYNCRDKEGNIWNFGSYNPWAEIK